MKEKARYTCLLLLILFFPSIWATPLPAQITPFLGASSPLLSSAYLSLYSNPFYYNTVRPISAFGQFDPSIDLSNVSLSLDGLYNPTSYRTYSPTSLQGLYNFSPSPFNYLWNSLVDSQDQTITINPYFATPYYYFLFNKDYFVDNPAERVVPLSLYTLYSLSPHLPELFYTASQAGLAPNQSYVNALGLSLFPFLLLSASVVM